MQAHDSKARHYPVSRFLLTLCIFDMIMKEAAGLPLVYTLLHSLVAYTHTCSTNYAYAALKKVLLCVSHTVLAYLVLISTVILD